jgi:hypothetical protein
MEWTVAGFTRVIVRQCVLPPFMICWLNLSRDFKFSSYKDHPRTLTLNARAANLLNHTNVTAVNTVLSSATPSDNLLRRRLRDVWNSSAVLVLARAAPARGQTSAHSRSRL